MAQNKGPAQQTFEKLNQVTGGVAGQFAKSVKTASQESLNQIANTPVDILKGLIGTTDTGTENAATGANIGTTIAPDGGDQPLGNPTEFQKKMHEDRQKRENLLRQHREMLAKYEQHYKQTQAQQEQLKQQVDVQEEQAKQQANYQKQQKQTPMWKKIIGMGGAQEGAKKKF